MACAAGPQPYLLTVQLGLGLQQESGQKVGGTAMVQGPFCPNGPRLLRCCFSLLSALQSQSDFRAVS